jgi:hypothetical protein
MWSNAPDWQTALSDGFLPDGLHLNHSGSEYYGTIAMNQLLEVPEPGAALSLMALSLTALRRNRKA